MAGNNDDDDDESSHLLDRFVIIEEAKKEGIEIYKMNDCFKFGPALYKHHAIIPS